ncbi:MAG: hypothetical protein CL943_01190 [Candidatus Diapherotrites archaeon]|uniref:Uncharacterized protein n=1 Tax=Candidatus Iainarchaeum sp. TaxID=3101447 RepID=A0A2D6M0E3_9ARCH|nr:hypothetical protein [Candidatus Diapherotrites archaeon]|tara:strand:+ start:183 stop:674 length:492 start_codon:yes stop_codon:yes gene_type:complete
MRAKILIVLVLLALFANSVFGKPPCTTVAPGGCIVTCVGKTEAVCGDYFYMTNGVGQPCAWTGTACGTGGSCDPLCSLGGTGVCATRVPTTTCVGLTKAACYTRYETGTPSRICYWDTPCAAMAVCIPEFMGIEFNEMEFSTGIIALIAAIALPTILFRKKKQ